MSPSPAGGPHRTNIAPDQTPAPTARMPGPPNAADIPRVSRARGGQDPAVPVLVRTDTAAGPVSPPRQPTGPRLDVRAPKARVASKQTDIATTRQDAPANRSCDGPKAVKGYTRTVPVHRDRGISSRPRSCIATAVSTHRRWPGPRYPPTDSRRLPRATVRPCARRSPPPIRRTPHPGRRRHRAMPPTRPRRNPSRSARTSPRAGDVAMFPRRRRAVPRAVVAGPRDRRAPSANGISSGGFWSCSWCSHC